MTPEPAAGKVGGDPSPQVSQVLFDGSIGTSRPGDDHPHRRAASTIRWGIACFALLAGGPLRASRVDADPSNGTWHVGRRGPGIGSAAIAGAIRSGMIRIRRVADACSWSSPRPMPETDEALDIRDPGLTDVLGDDDALSLWEMMRRASAATEAETLAGASGRSLEWVHDCLDRLVEADLVEMVRATSRRPTTRWRVRRETIIVGYRVNDPLDEVLIQCVDELFGPRRRKQIEAHVRRGTARRGPHERWRRSWAGDLDVAEIRRFWDLMQELARLYHAAGSRFVGSPPSQE
jgi:hypothetical protein